MTTTDRRWAVLVGSAVLSVTYAAAAAAQDDATALSAHAHTLETRIAHSPSSRMRCDLGFTYFRLARMDDAARELDTAIIALGRPTRAADRRLLAQCLYSRGRVAQAQHDLQTARSAYERSRSLHDTPDTREAATSLARRSIAELGPEERAAAAVCNECYGGAGQGDDGAPGTYDVYVVEPVPSSGATRWSIVHWGADYAWLAVVACEGERCRVRSIDDVTGVYPAERTTYEIRQARMHEGPSPFLEVRVHVVTTEIEDEGTRWASVDEERLHICTQTSEGPVCAQVVLVDHTRGGFAIDATLDDAGATFHLRSGRVPSDGDGPTPVPLDRALSPAELLDLRPAGPDPAARH